VSKFSYSFELKRIPIFRPWFDQQLFENRGWTWAFKQSDMKFPLIALKPREDGSPVASKDEYKTVKVGLALVPAQLILVRKVTIKVTVSKASWEKAKKEVGGQGAGTFFGIIAIGGGGSGVDEKNVTGTNDVELTCSQPDISILGTISRVVPSCPNPVTKGERWSPDAWLP
jgi:hypothetical protein